LADHLHVVVVDGRLEDDPDLLRFEDVTDPIRRR
jgi:hypothetical protein